MTYSEKEAALRDSLIRSQEVLHLISHQIDDACKADTPAMLLAYIKQIERDNALYQKTVSELLARAKDLSEAVD